MMFVHLWCFNMELQFIQFQARISRKSAVHWNSFCREVTMEFCIREGKPVGGPNLTVEIDESKFRKRKYNKRHFVEGQWIFGACRETGDFFLLLVEDPDSATWKSLIEEWILPGTTIISDCWKAYEKLDEATFQDLIVNHSINFKDPQTGANTNKIEGLWGHVKCRLSLYNRRKGCFVDYLSKLIFINFCKRKGLDPTVEFFKAAGILYSPYKVTADQEESMALEEEREEDDEDYEEEEDYEEDEDYGEGGPSSLRENIGGRYEEDIEDSN